MNRRQLLQNSLCTAVGWAIGNGTSLGQKPMAMETNATVASEVSLAHFVDRCPVPPVIRPAGKPGEIVEVEMRQFQQKVHRDLPPTTLWGYNGSWPGPTFEVRKGQPCTIKWLSKLPSKHFLPVDTTLHGAESTLPEVRNVVHVHGARVMPENDGYPEAWFTSAGQEGPKFNRYPSVYPNDQPAAPLWYHDHCLGITRLNIYAGLAGFYFIRDEAEVGLNLPSGEFEIPLMIQDRAFHKDGSLLYPKAVNGTHPVWVQEFFGDMHCVNGRVMPFLEVEPRKYRFSLLNACNSRFLRLRLYDWEATGRTNRSAPLFHQIGADGGLLPAPVNQHYVFIAPAERVDVIVDFSGLEGRSLSMVNNAPAPYARSTEVLYWDVMLFRVTKPLSGKDTSSLPPMLRPFDALIPADAVRERVIWITEKLRSSDGYVEVGLVGNARWHDPVTEDPGAGTTEIWSFANATEDVHPMHVHLVQFQILNRQPFDVPGYRETGKLVFTGPPIQPEQDERPATKDTVKAFPGQVTRIILKFELPRTGVIKPGQEFLYVYHCHMLEHEDNDMMRPYKVIV
jgi:spore coat protein A